jgi:hypothetical protein
MITESPKWTEEDTLNLRIQVGTIKEGTDLLLADHKRLQEETDSLRARVAELEADQEHEPPTPTITLDTLGPFELRDSPRVVKATVTNAPEGAMVFWRLNGAVVDQDQPHNATFTIDPAEQAVGQHRITAWLSTLWGNNEIAYPPLAEAGVQFTVVRPAEPGIPTVIRTQLDLWGPDSIWTRPLAADAPIHADSEAMVDELWRQTKAYGRNINATKWTTALNVADADTPRLPVVSTGGNGDWWKALNPMAWDDGFRIDPERDLHATVIETDTQLVKGLWHAREGDGVMFGEYGGATPMRGADGITPANGETASNLPAIGGTILRSEWALAMEGLGDLDHALAMSIPQQWPGHVWPAKRTDRSPNVPAGVPENAQIPMGTHFRLPASWRASGAESMEARTLCYALRDHGAYVRDKAGDVVFYAELADEPLMPWAKLQSVLAEIPWGELQVVDHGPRTRRAGL